MRTNIVLDDELVKQAFKVTHLRTKKALITIALKEFLQNHSRKNIRDLQGKIRFYKGYDHKSLRQ